MKEDDPITHCHSLGAFGAQAAINIVTKIVVKTFFRTKNVNEAEVVIEPAIGVENISTIVYKIDLIIDYDITQSQILVLIL